MAKKVEMNLWELLVVFVFVAVIFIAGVYAWGLLR